jgi:hypothetical protein
MEPTSWYLRRVDLNLLVVFQALMDERSFTNGSVTAKRTVNVRKSATSASHRRCATFSQIIGCPKTPAS